MTEKIQKIGKYSIYYKEFTSESKGNIPIVILHGWGGKSDSWELVGKGLSKLGFTVIIPDLPGFGKTKLHSIFSLDDYATIIENFLEELGIENPILWGHSNGGAISIKIASRNKYKISRLVLNNSAGIRNDTKRNQKRKIFLTLTKIIKKIAPLLPQNIKKYSQQKIRPIFYKIIGSQDYIESEKSPKLKQTYLNIIHTDITSLIPNIKQNTLIIWGEKDTYTPQSDGKIMKKLIRNSKIVILENEKHGIHIHNPDLLVQTFIQNI